MGAGQPIQSPPPVPLSKGLSGPQGCIRTAVHRRRRGGYPPPPLRPPPPPLPMFEADSQNFASAPSVPRGFTLQNFRPPFGGGHRGILGGGGGPSQPPPPSPPPSNTSLGGQVRCLVDTRVRSGPWGGGGVRAQPKQGSVAVWKGAGVGYGVRAALPRAPRCAARATGAGHLCRPMRPPGPPLATPTGGCTGHTPAAPCPRFDRSVPPSHRPSAQEVTRRQRQPRLGLWSPLSDAAAWRPGRWWSAGRRGGLGLGGGGWDGMGVCPTPARHVARPTLCVSGLRHRLPRAGLGATQTTTDPVRDRRVKFPYPHSLGTLVGVTSGASGPHSRTHTHTMSFHGPDRGAWRAPRKAVSGVSALTRMQWQSLQVPHRAAVAEAHRRRCTVRDMMHEVRAEPLDWGEGGGGHPC